MNPQTHKRTALALGAILMFVVSACSAQGPGRNRGETVDLEIADNIVVPAADTKAEAIVTAATNFLSTLSDARKDAVVYAFDDNAQRARWSNFPLGLVPRGGILRDDLNEEQDAALDTLLGEVMSADGYRNAKLQMAADDTLDGGQRMQFGSEYYYVAFVGEPATDTPWMFQFGGHHLAINVTFVGSQASFSPMLTGGQPMTVMYEGEEVYIARKEIEAAQAFLDSLNTSQKAVAVQGSSPIQLLLGPGEQGTVVAPEGIRGSELNNSQKELLLAVVEARIGLFNTRDAQAKMAVVREDINDTYFGWWGPEVTPGAAYFRITGPEIVMEFAPQRMRGNDPTEHAHNMYRDPTNDYGAAWISAED